MRRSTCGSLPHRTPITASNIPWGSFSWMSAASTMATRMGDGFELRAHPRIREDDLAEHFPVDPAVRRQDLLSEPTDDLDVGGLPRRGDLPGDPVRIHDGNIFLPEKACHGALTGPDSSRQAVYAHGRNHTTGGGTYGISGEGVRR